MSEDDSRSPLLRQRLRGLLIPLEKPREGIEFHLVIPTEAKRSGGICSFAHRRSHANEALQ